MLSITASSRRAITRSLNNNRIQATLKLSNGNKNIIHPSSLLFNSPHCHRLLSSLPYHLVVGMPALSPTMEAGTISSWKVGEGESFVAGDSLAEIETDKATIDFEAQDDGVVAKILVESGSGEINVGVPILVTVEEEDDVAAFKDFVLEDGGSDGSDATAVPPAEAVDAAPLGEGEL